MNAIFLLITVTIFNLTTQRECAILQHRVKLGSVPRFEKYALGIHYRNHAFTELNENRLSDNPTSTR